MPFQMGEWIDLGDQQTKSLFQEIARDDRGLKVTVETVVGDTPLRRWTNEEIFNLLRDGFKYRQLQQGEKIRLMLKEEAPLIATL